MGFKFLDHTADILVELRADTFEELFRTAAQAFYSVTLKNPLQESETLRDISIASSSREELLVRWLQELIFLLEVENFCAMKVEFVEINEEHLNARLIGAICSAEERADEVKSATYHELNIHENNGEYITQVVLDI